MRWDDAYPPPAVHPAAVVDTQITVAVFEVEKDQWERVQATVEPGDGRRRAARQRVQY